MSPNAIALSSSCRDLSTRFSNFSPRSIARSRASLTAACVPLTPPRAPPPPPIAPSRAAVAPSPACRSPNKASRWSCAWAEAAPLPAAARMEPAPPALDEKDERVLPNPPPPMLDSRETGCRRGEGSTANTSAMLFFDPPRDNRPSIPLADLPFGAAAPVLPALPALPPPEDCLLIAGGLAKAETLTKRGLEPVSMSQASSVNSDHRVKSCDERGRFMSKTR